MELHEQTKSMDMAVGGTEEHDDEEEERGFGDSFFDTFRRKVQPRTSLGASGKVPRTKVLDGRTISLDSESEEEMPIMSGSSRGGSSRGGSSRGGSSRGQAAAADDEDEDGMEIEDDENEDETPRVFRAETVTMGGGALVLDATGIICPKGRSSCVPRRPSSWCAYCRAKGQATTEETSPSEAKGKGKAKAKAIKEQKQKCPYNTSHCPRRLCARCKNGPRPL